MSRRRTIGGLESLPGNHSEPLPRQPVQQRPEPRPRSNVVSSASEVTDGTATLRRKPQPLPVDSEAPESVATTVVTMTTGSDTVRRRPRTSEQTECVTQSNNQTDSPDSSRKSKSEPQPNGGVVLRRRPVSEAAERTETHRESCEWMEARRSLKPPVSPKPSSVAMRKTQADPPTPTRRVPIPGPDSPEVAQSPGESTDTHNKHTNKQIKTIYLISQHDFTSCILCTLTTPQSGPVARVKTHFMQRFSPCEVFVSTFGL